MKNKLVIVISILCCLSCVTTQKQVLSDLNRIYDCKDNWINNTVGEPMKVKVILFDKRLEATTATYPALLIGVTMERDTIALIDKRFSGILNIGQTITLVHEEWTDYEKMQLNPLPGAGKDRKRNNLYCIPKVVYRGKIVL